MRTTKPSFGIGFVFMTTFDIIEYSNGAVLFFEWVKTTQPELQFTICKMFILAVRGLANVTTKSMSCGLPQT